jgi:hypothetical protein
MVGASIGGVVLAADDTAPAATATTTPPAVTTSSDALLDKIIAIYQEKTGALLDKDALQASIEQARKEMRLADIQARLERMVAAGKLTQEEADQVLAWYQAMPDVLNGKCFSLGGHGHGAGWLGGLMRR